MKYPMTILLCLLTFPFVAYGDERILPLGAPDFLADELGAVDLDPAQITPVQINLETTQIRPDPIQIDNQAMVNGLQRSTGGIIEESSTPVRVAGAVKFANGGRQDAAAALPNIQCLNSQISGWESPDTFCGVPNGGQNTITGCDESTCQTVTAGEGEEAVRFQKFKAIEGSAVDFQDHVSCSNYLRGGASSGQAEDGGYNIGNLVGGNFKMKLCRLAASVCEGNTTASPYYRCFRTPDFKAALRSVISGARKCVAVLSAGNGTEGFGTGPAGASLDGRVSCKAQRGKAFDYKSCTQFIAWYNGLVAAQTGVQIYNEVDKTNQGIRAQRDAAREAAEGNGQAAGVEAARTSTLAAASAEERNKAFFIAKGAAIGAQLGFFTTPGNIENKCEEHGGCCALFDQEGPDSITNAESYFPNQGTKAAMIAEIIRAGGEAALAALKEQTLKDQAKMLKATEEQITAAGDESEEGIMRFCVQNPQDPKCLGPGRRVSTSGTAFGGPGFSGQNFGLGTLDPAAQQDINTDLGSGSAAAGGNENPVAAIGDMNKEAAAAKNEFDKPSAARGGGGSPNFSPQSGTSASASANGLSNDPGVEGDKKENPLKITSKNVSYDGGGATYAGGGWRPGTEKKEAEAANPFAAMFGKDKGRTPANVQEIDAPASDLFTKISNRYQEVQKRKALLEVR